MYIAMHAMHTIHVPHMILLTFSKGFFEKQYKPEKGCVGSRRDHGCLSSWKGLAPWHALPAAVKTQPSLAMLRVCYSFFFIS